MKTIVVKRSIKESIEKVFDAITDHENYQEIIGLQKSFLIQKGQLDKNGVGSVRRIEVETGLIWFEEEITHFNRPYRMDYQIQRCRPILLKHFGGSICLSESNRGTDVVWTSDIELSSPVAKNWVTSWIGIPLGKIGFSIILQQLANRLEKKK